MSLSQIEVLHLQEAIASEGISIPLNDFGELTPQGVCEVIKTLGKLAREQKTNALRSTAERKRAEYLYTCHLNDTNKWERLAKDRGKQADNAGGALAQAVDLLNESLKRLDAQKDQELCKKIASFVDLATLIVCPP